MTHNSHIRRSIIVLLRASWRLSLAACCGAFLLPLSTSPFFPTSGSAIAQQSVPREGLHFIKRTQENTHLVVFIHGVAGHPITTFENMQDKTIWPIEMARDATLKQHDIAVYGYDPSKQNTLEIEELANHLQRAINNNAGWQQYQQIHFVAHSFGGVVAQSMIIRLRDTNASRKERPYDHIGHVFLFAVPSRGERLAALIDYVVNVNPKIAAALAGLGNSNTMAILDRRWTSAISDHNRSMKVHCFYETKPLNLPPFIIVPRETITTGCDADPIALLEDHSTIVKPGKPNSARRTAYHEVAEVLNTRNATNRAPPGQQEIGISGADNIQNLLHIPQSVTIRERQSIRIKGTLFTFREAFDPYQGSRGDRTKAALTVGNSQKSLNVGESMIGNISGTPCNITLAEVPPTPNGRLAVLNIHCGR